MRRRGSGMAQAEAETIDELADGAGLRYGIRGRTEPYKETYPTGGESVSGVRHFPRVIIGASDHRWSPRSGLQIKP